jgi:hypothetical protein
VYFFYLAKLNDSFCRNIRELRVWQLQRFEERRAGATPGAGACRWRQATSGRTPGLFRPFQNKDDLK